ncbi:MAG: phosphoadenylyl-sulfate reductase [Steroidobacteraceae bacterium]
MAEIAAAAAAPSDARLADLAAGSVDVLRQAVRQFGKVVYASSLGAEAIVLADLIWTQVPEIDIVTIDTGRLPEETLELLERLERRYRKRVRVIYPDAEQVEHFVSANGINGFYLSLEARQACCHVRKVVPFRKIVAGYAAWVTGVRRDQSEARARNAVVAQDDRYGLAKVSPLLDWSEADVWGYIRAHKLPYNVLHDRNYPSIGCAPCSRAIEPGQDQRAGRWWWENPDTRECGLQPRQPRVASHS